MRNLKNYIVSCIILIPLLTSCETIQLKQVGNCTILSNYAFCTDARRSDGNQEYELDFSEMKGFQCVSPADYQILHDDIEGYLKELSKLRRTCSKSRSKRSSKLLDQK